jgi:hypothetical protein
MSSPQPRCGKTGRIKGGQQTYGPADRRQGNGSGPPRLRGNERREPSNGHGFDPQPAGVHGPRDGIEQLEQIDAVIVTVGLVAGNFVMFTPWRNGEGPRQRTQVHSIQQTKR